MNKCIRMGITASNLSFEEVNRGFTVANYVLNEIYDRKTADLPPQMPNLNAVIP